MNSAQSSEFQQQKEFYWKIRDELLDKYSGKWVSIAQNKIAAIAESPTVALREAYEKTKAKVMYINKVGEEKKVMRKRIIPICPHCEGEVIEKKVEKLVKGGCNAAVLTVEAGVCTKCGERTI